MRTIDSAITTVMESDSRKVFCEIKIITSEPSTSEDFNTTNKLINIQGIEEPYAGSCRIILKDYDQALKNKDYTGRRVRIGFGYNTTGSPANRAIGYGGEVQPFWIIHHNVVSEAGATYVVLECESIFNRLALEPLGVGNADAPSQAPNYNVTVGSAGGVTENRTEVGLPHTINDLVEDMLDQIKPSGFTSAGIPLVDTPLVTGQHDGSDGLSALNDSTADFIDDGVQVGDWLVNVTDGSSVEITSRSAIQIFGTLAGGTANNWDEDDVYKVFDALYYNDLKPMMVFRWNTPALDIIKITLEMTRTVLRMQEFGADMEAIYPSDTKVNEQYEFGGSGKIKPFSVGHQKQVERPNRVYVVDVEPEPGGEDIHRFVGAVDNSVSMTRYGVMPALFGPTTDEQEIEDQDEADSRAASLMRKINSESAEALIVTTPHIFLELFDRVKIVDSRLAPTTPPEGFVGRIEWRLNLDEKLGPIQFEQEIRVGGLRKYAWTSTSQTLMGPGGPVQLGFQTTTRMSEYYGEVERHRIGPRELIDVDYSRIDLDRAPAIMGLLQRYGDIPKRFGGGGPFSIPPIVSQPIQRVAGQEQSRQLVKFFEELRNYEREQAIPEPDRRPRGIDLQPAQKQIPKGRPLAH